LAETFVYTNTLYTYITIIVVFLIALFTRVSLLSSKINNGCDTPKDSLLLTKNGVFLEISTTFYNTKFQENPVTILRDMEDKRRPLLKIFIANCSKYSLW